jgi:hypothetical protein
MIQAILFKVGLYLSGVRITIILKNIPGNFFIYKNENEIDKKVSGKVIIKRMTVYQ